MAECILQGSIITHGYPTERRDPTAASRSAHPPKDKQFRFTETPKYLRLGLATFDLKSSALRGEKANKFIAQEKGRAAWKKRSKQLL